MITEYETIEWNIKMSIYEWYETSSYFNVRILKKLFIILML